MKRETEKVTAASGDALRQLEHQTKVVRGELGEELGWKRVESDAMDGGTWMNHQ